MKDWVILRDDGHYYLGTIDKLPVFGHGEAAAIFKEKDRAEARANGLTGHTVEVVPA